MKAVKEVRKMRTEELKRRGSAEGPGIFKGIRAQTKGDGKE